MQKQEQLPNIFHGRLARMQQNHPSRTFMHALRNQMRLLTEGIIQMNGNWISEGEYWLNGPKKTAEQILM